MYLGYKVTIHYIGQVFKERQKEDIIGHATKGPEKTIFTDGNIYNR